MRRKITVIGAGHVGAVTAHGILTKQLGDVILLDVQGGVAQGTALDLMQMAPLVGFSSSVQGVTDYRDTADSDVVVITAGMARRPGMSREDLVTTNAQIVWEVTRRAAVYSPNAHLIVVTNPLDVMCYVALKASGFPPQRVYGQSGVLDSARFRTFVAIELGVAYEDVHALVLGGHGDDMVPLVRHAFVGCVPLCYLLTPDRIQELVNRTRHGGAEIVSLLKQGSAYFAPAASTVHMIEAVLQDKKRIMPVSVYLQGEYGLSDLYFGIPAVVGAKGVEQVIELELNSEERALLIRSAERVRQAMKIAKEHLRGTGACK
ncbi:malate dehydrogenase [Kyrpidia spormannii]|uniref:Malate dehydrogenase n=2 Tax=Kyrpidia spormannii TaxID=2055160 RepID=A0A6F9ED58_9BACL|nr:malate dehydrogenase [Kyrpidia spormannii]CAB3394341.1 malate dehydrogenase (NAD-dependent) [Kyrpidia spormannii]CAB3395279.1 malate dehydrogenase (NAD-dependent) [Kyrpidia spormannii]